MTETTARIRWHEEYTGTFYGRVGTLESWGFELWQSPGDCGDYVLGDWVLTAPFIFADRCLMNGRQTLSDRDPEKLKDDAERLLGEFTTSLGAVFPGGRPDGNAIGAYCATEAGDGDGRHLLQYAVRLPGGTTTAYGDQSWVKAGLGARDHDGASTVVRDIWVSYGPWRTHGTGRN